MNPNTLAPAEARSTDAELVARTKAHTLFEWAAQSKVDPIPVAGAKGCWFWTPEGKRYLDFNSQLMCVNIGHGDERVIKAIQQQAATLAYANPFMATEPRARLGEKLASIAPGDIDVFFFTNGGAEANENAIKIARMYTGRHKILARYRSYHGGTARGDHAHRRSAPLGRGARHPRRRARSRPVSRHPARLGRRRTSRWRTSKRSSSSKGPQTIAAFFLETVTGTNGVLVPPDGYLEGVRGLCTKYGILMVADEVMAGFGRTGEWFAINHWNVVPDLLTMAKGLTSAYVPLGAVGMRRAIADHFTDKVFYGGLTYNSHPIGCATALATIAVYEEDDLIARARTMGEVMKRHMRDLESRHPIVGAARSLGLFGIVELVKDRTSMEPLAPFNGTSEPMLALGRFLREEGLYTFVRWNTVMTNPPLTITEEELAHGFDIIDRGLKEIA